MITNQAQMRCYSVRVSSSMYLKFASNLEFPDLGRLLAPDMPDDAFDCDSENVYEWMYVDLPDLGFSLNVSREHGWADLDDELLDLHDGLDNEELKKLLKPGPVYVIGWDRTASDYVDPLPDWLARYIAERLSVDVFVYSQRINVDLPDPEPLAIVKPTSTTDD